MSGTQSNSNDHPHGSLNLPEMPPETSSVNGSYHRGLMEPGDGSTTNSSKAPSDIFTRANTVTSLSQPSISNLAHTNIARQDTQSSSISNRKDPYRRRVPVQPLRRGLGLSQTVSTDFFIYPFSTEEISQEKLSQLKDIADTCKWNLRDNTACKKVGAVGFDYCMCGTSPENAQPTIVVTVAAEFIDIVCHTLTRDQIYEYHDLIRCAHAAPLAGIFGIFGLLFRWIRRQHEPTDLPIVFVADEPTNPRCGPNRHSEASFDWNIEQSRDKTACGLRIQVPGTQTGARLTCMLDIDGDICGLAAAHTFYPYCFKSTSLPFKSSMAGQDTIVKKEDHGPVEEQKSSSGYSSCCQLMDDEGLVLDSVHAWLPSLAEKHSQISNNDWAVLSLREMSSRLSNQFVVPDNVSKLRRVQDIASEHPGLSRDVYILSSTTSVRQGRLLRGVTHLVIPGQENLALWCIELDDDCDFPKGESGSLVVDAESGQAYGYVVSVSPLGIVQLVPLCTIVKQIKQTMKADKVSLAYPVPRLSALDSSTAEVHCDALLNGRSEPEVAQQRGTSDCVHFHELGDNRAPMQEIQAGDTGEPECQADERQDRPKDAANFESSSDKRSTVRLPSEDVSQPSWPRQIPEPLEGIWKEDRTSSWISTSALQSRRQHRLLTSRVPRREEFRIAIICALSIEAAAVTGVFDEIYEVGISTWSKANSDLNPYTLGRIGQHDVILTNLPGNGQINATIVASSMRTTFPALISGLTIVVGICSGAARNTYGKDIYLGDVIISTGLLHGKDFQEPSDDILVENQSIQDLRPAPPSIQSWLRHLQTKEVSERAENATAAYLAFLCRALDMEQPDMQSDQLLPASYVHKHHGTSGLQCYVCAKETKTADWADDCWPAQVASCALLGCQTSDTRFRPEDHPLSQPRLHFGSMYSADRVFRSGQARDELVKKQRVIGFEMGGAGVWNVLPTLVIKGVCDYADSHKNKSWQQYASATAAAGLKAMLETWDPTPLVSEIPTASFVTEEARKRDCLNSLAFEGMETRFHKIPTAQATTRNWILDTKEFQSWFNRKDDRILWIIGKPGSGKSTLMRLIYQEIALSTVVVSSFHHGTDSKRSTTCIYRSLLHQLLNQDQALLRRFLSVFCHPSQENVRYRQWSSLELHNFLLLCSKQGWTTNATILIDGLDEYDGPGIQQLLHLCTDLTGTHARNKARLRVCLSGRYMPVIQRACHNQICIDQRLEHDLDIEKYIHEKLLQYSDSVADLALDIKQKARGMFIWVKLVVDTLNKLHDQGASDQARMKFLTSIPSEIHALYDSILQSGQGNKYETILLLSLVQFASWPLSPRELYLLHIGAKHQTERIPDTTTLPGWFLESFVTTTSKGLLECQWSPHHSSSTSDQPIVHLVHQTMEEFLHTFTSEQNIEKYPQISEEQCHELIARVSLGVMWTGRFMDYAFSKDTIELVFLTHVASMKNGSKMGKLLQEFTAYISTHRGRLSDMVPQPERQPLLESSREWSTRSHVSSDSGCVDCESSSCTAADSCGT